MPKPQLKSKTGAVGYIRCSTERQEISPDVQRDTITRWARLNNIKIIAIHEDIGVSGAMPWVERPGLTAAVNDVKRHDAAWLVVAVLDRLSRDLYNMLHLQRELEEFDARVISCTENPAEELSPEKTLMTNIVSSFAQFEKAKIQGRVKAALALRKAQGIKLGALPLEDTELGRCIIWAAWTLRDQGLGAKAVAKKLNELGVTGPRGGCAHYRNIQRMFKRARPTQEPRLWKGLGRATWNQFGSTRFVQNSNRDRDDLGQVRGPKKSTGAAKSDPTPAGDSQ